MTSALDHPSPSKFRSSGWTDRMPVVGRSRRPLLVVASGLLVVVSIAMFASLYSSANHQTTVLVVVNTIDQGQQITAGDLGQASVSISSGVVPIAVADAHQLSGKRASVTIPAGSLLTMADVSGGETVATGDAIVGIALKTGQLPAGGVKVGDHVMMVLTNSPGTPVTGMSTAASSASSGEATTGVLIPRAAVFGVDLPSANSSSGTSLLVSVEVPQAVAADVATAAAADQVSLVLLPIGNPVAHSSGTVSG
jgi:SAF domain